MINFLVKLFVKNNEQIHLPEVRARYGMMTGGIGIFLNLCLFGAKFVAGLLTSSIAITADAFNNLSDAGSSVVTLVGFRMAGIPADSEHPFGHGRIEYLSGLAVSMAIILVGFELLKTSFGKILHPEPVEFNWISMAILVVSILVKLWMSHFNRTIGKRIDSAAMYATAMDSFTDVVATSAVAVGTLIGHWFQWQIDGWIGLLVAGFILYTGYSTARDSLSPLLGKAPDKEFVQSIAQTVLANPEIRGIHDLIVHDYGPGRSMISLHAEVPCDMDIMTMHDAIDRVELELRQKFHCEVTIHMDPIETNNTVTEAVHAQVLGIIHKIDPALSIHDFRMVQGATHTNLIFDLQVPYRFSIPDAQLADQVRERVQEIDAGYYAVIKVEKAFS